VTAVCSAALLHSPYWQLSFLAAVFLLSLAALLPLFALFSLSYSIQPVVSNVLSSFTSSHLPCPGRDCSLQHRFTSQPFLTALLPRRSLLAAPGHPLTSFCSFQSLILNPTTCFFSLSL
jgi:hypothetical protein